MAWICGWRHDPPRDDDREFLCNTRREAYDIIKKELTWIAIDDPVADSEHRERAMDIAVRIEVGRLHTVNNFHCDYYDWTYFVEEV